ncbi:MULTISPECIES: ROK family protein [Lactobacillus]|uniref:ROK family protein n=1 Tax=Lactobacillus xujianguonis TaxID=2495899 RepID=A0A437SUL5_9LACO|nr:MULTISPECIES: ROK family protein [Lactobacillus]RVU70629.1 ROK family protein [Lactobacillus xujianguonis]
MNLMAIDIGGTTIKLAYWKNGQLTNEHAVDTPKDLESFYQVLTKEVNQAKTAINAKGVAISSPGAVDQKTGIIGGTSALPYIHNFKIQAELEKRFSLPVTLENDANCAALGELAAGSGQGCNSIAFFVIGTGIGGAMIMNQRIWHGAHLYGGEFGYMMIDNDQLSSLASPVASAKRYNERTVKNFTGKELFEAADQGDAIAEEERDKMLHSLAVAIFNIQHSFDPEKIVLGGGISNNPELLPLLNSVLAKIVKKVPAAIMPDLALCQLKSEANLRGAVANFEQQH